MFTNCRIIASRREVNGMNKDQERNVEQYLSTRELMEILSISRSTVCRLINKGIPNIMVGSVHRFPMEQVIAWLEKSERTHLEY